jgi:hypothetical protein
MSGVAVLDIDPGWDLMGSVADMTSKVRHNECFEIGDQLRPKWTQKEKPRRGKKQHPLLSSPGPFIPPSLALTEAVKCLNRFHTCNSLLLSRPSP